MVQRWEVDRGGSRARSQWKRYVSQLSGHLELFLCLAVLAAALADLSVNCAPGLFALPESRGGSAASGNYRRHRIQIGTSAFRLGLALPQT